jgi:hypothetical protein
MWQTKTEAWNFLARSSTWGKAFIDASEKSVTNRMFFRLAAGIEEARVGSVAI